MRVRTCICVPVVAVFFFFLVLRLGIERSCAVGRLGVELGGHSAALQHLAPLQPPQQPQQQRP